ncbi:MAG: BCCT family transporter, partial [Emcibacteraceae bacterium]|nr:BCCT family transporter [Emcibacteraceae bacterium]
MPLSHDDVNNSSRTQNDTHPDASIDFSVFIPSFVLSLIAIVYLITNKDAAVILSGEMVAYVTANWGWLFVLSGFGAFGFCIWLAFGRYAHVKLGTKDEKTE